MAAPDSDIHSFWFTTGLLESTGSTALNEPEPISASQYFVDEPCPWLQDYTFDRGLANAPPDGAHSLESLPFCADPTFYLDSFVSQDDMPEDPTAQGCTLENVSSFFPGTSRIDAAEKKGPPNRSTNKSVDKKAAQFCDNWLRLYPDVYPKDADISALSQLTRQPPASIEQWLNRKIRTVKSSSRDSGIGSSSSSTVSYVSLSQGGATNSKRSESTLAALEIACDADEATLTETISPQIITKSYKKHQTGRKAVRKPVNSGFELLAAIPAAWSTSPLVSASLEDAEEISRIRTSCHPTSDISCLRRNPDRPLQCTRKCGYATALKKDWKRHESIAFPQHGFLCTIPAAIRIGDHTYCAYCPTEHLQLNPTIRHMASEHGLTFVSECDMEFTICKQIRYRKDKMESHFSKKHPGIHPDAWVNIGAFNVKNSAFSKRCGFCPKIFASWDKRIDHIQVHFDRDHLDMRQWRDCGSSDDHHRNKRRRDDDSDNGSDAQDSDDDDEDDFGGGSSGTRSRSNGFQVNTKAQHSGGGQSGQSQPHDCETASSSDESPASDDEQLSDPERVSEWLDDVSKNAETHLNEENCVGGAKYIIIPWDVTARANKYLLEVLRNCDRSFIGPFYPRVADSYRKLLSVTKSNVEKRGPCTAEAHVLEQIASALHTGESPMTITVSRALHHWRSKRWAERTPTLVSVMGTTGAGKTVLGKTVLSAVQEALYDLWAARNQVPTWNPTMRGDDIPFKFRASNGFDGSLQPFPLRPSEYTHSTMHDFLRHNDFHNRSLIMLSIDFGQDFVASSWLISVDSTRLRSLEDPLNDYRYLKIDVGPCGDDEGPMFPYSDVPLL
jgi:hypothetical protein